MVFNDTQFSMNLGSEFTLSQDRGEYRDVIVDRKSKYTVTALRVDSQEDVKTKFKSITSESYFKKATHNSYGFRILQDNGSIIEGKNDDGEQGAGMCILRELQREDALGMMLIVTRYFGGIQLHTDRFKNVIDACKIFFKNNAK